MLRRALPLVLAAGVIVPVLAQMPLRSPTLPSPAPQAPSRAAYFPERLDWQHKRPQEVGMSPALVNEAVPLAIAADTPGPKDMTQFLANSFGKEPFLTLVGPVTHRG